MDVPFLNNASPKDRAEAESLSTDKQAHSFAERCATHQEAKQAATILSRAPIHESKNNS